MSDNADSQNYINNFMNSILINPLAQIVQRLNAGQIQPCLVAMRNYIASLPPTIREEMKPHSDELNKFFGGFNQVKGRNFPHTAELRINYVQRYGQPLAVHVYDALFSFIYSGQLFEALKGTPYELQGQGPSVFSYGKP